MGEARTRAVRPPRPFKWTKSADEILAAAKRFCLRVEQNYATNFRVRRLALFLWMERGPELRSYPGGPAGAPKRAMV